MSTYTNKQMALKMAIEMHLDPKLNNGGGTWSDSRASRIKTAEEFFAFLGPDPEPYVFVTPPAESRTSE